MSEYRNLESIKQIYVSGKLSATARLVLDFPHTASHDDLAQLMVSVLADMLAKVAAAEVGADV